MAAGVGPVLEPMPCGGIATVGVLGLGVPEATNWAASRSGADSSRESLSCGNGGQVRGRGDSC